MIDIFFLMAALITVLVTLVVIYAICGDAKLKTLVANIALHHITGVEATDTNRFQDAYCTCKMQWYSLAM